MEILETLFSLQDIGYRDFQVPTIPTVPKENMIGVRTPALRSLAKELSGTAEAQGFLNQLPHKYFDENQLHAFLIALIKDYDTALSELERFLPYIDNGATCDQLSPKVFKKHRDTLIPHIRKWIGSAHLYTVRFGIGMLMEHYLDDYFRPEYPELVIGIRSEEYYINMMRAWYFATALAKQYDAVLPVLEEQRLDLWTHNKTIQKARESRRITEEQKELLKSLKRQG